VSPRLAHGARDTSGTWHPADPDAYPPMDVHGTLPWSVLRQDSRTWQARKKWWLDQGVDDTGPRAEASSMVATGRHGVLSGGVSRFDPHLTEVLLSWYCPPGGLVLDPFAGGPVRGLVAGCLGYAYTGVDLLETQVAANRERAQEWARDARLAAVPEWAHGAAQDVLPGMLSGTADYVLTCPPYHNRERYSDHPSDLSAMRWPQFLAAYRNILTEAVRLLRPDRFATIVVSDVRDHRGHLCGLPALTTAAMLDAGCHLTNEQVLIAPSGTFAKLMRPAWTAARTTTRIHQHVLTYVKGDRRAATTAVRTPGGA
jgi:hypothetical protein